MLDIQNIGLVELNAQEVQEVEGGFWGALGVWFAWETFGNPVSSYNSFMRGLNGY